MQARKFYLDTQSRSFVASPDGTLPAGGLLLFEEDVEAVELYFLEPTGNFSQPYRYIDYTGNTITLALGTTQPAAALTSFSAISTTVALTASVAITGGSGTTAVQKVEIAPRPATGSYSLRLPARNVTVSSVSSSVFFAPFHALLNGQSVTLTGFSTPSGFSNGVAYWVRDRSRDTFRISATAGATALTVSVASGGGTAETLAATTDSVRAGGGPAEIASLLAAAAGAAAPQIGVSGASDDFLLTYGGDYGGADMPLIEIVSNTLAGAPGLSGNLSLNTVEIAALVAAGTTEVTLEVEVSDGTLRQTYQQAATLGNDIITSTSPVPLPAGASFNLTSPDSSTWQVTIDNDGILTAEKQ